MNFLDNFLNFFNGYKTYIVAFFTAAYCVVCYWNGQMDFNTLMLTLAGILGGLSVRHTIVRALAVKS